MRGWGRVLISVIGCLGPTFQTGVPLNLQEHQRLRRTCWVLGSFLHLKKKKKNPSQPLHNKEIKKGKGADSVPGSSVQFSRSVMSDSLRPHESQHARPPCPSPTPRVHSDSCPSSQGCHQPSHPLSSPSPPAPNPSQHQSLFQ